MAYCTQSDLEHRFGTQEVIQLTDLAGAGSVDEDRLNQAIADADAQIDRKLRGRYSVPITPPPAELVPIACDLARYYLYDDNAPDIVKERYNAALRELRDYASGINQLDLPGGTADAGHVAVCAPSVVFSDATLGKMP
jgi:phage gp36-like protein